MTSPLTGHPIVAQFTSPLMRKRYYLVAWLIARERKMMVLFTIFEIVSLSFGLLMTLCLLIYFNAAPAGLKTHPMLGPLGPEKLVTLAAATALGVGSLAAKLGQGFMDARVTSNREAWYSERLRALPLDHPTRGVPSRELSRGSHYYGRLAGATLHIVAAVVAFGLTLVGLLIALPPMAKLALFAVVVVSVPPLLALGFFIARKLKRSAVGLVDNSRQVALWKANSEIATTDTVREYYQMYFFRIFLVGLFGYMNLLFIAVFMLVLLINGAFDLFAVTFGGVFFAYIAAQFYLGSLSRLITNLVKIAAFIPFAEAVFEPGQEPV